jgi:hypothetical protein
MKQEVYNKIISKKEFSNLPKRDVEKIYSLYEKRQTIEEEKIKLTRDMLRKVFFAFGSQKILNLNILNKKTFEEVLQKHISTKERFSFFREVYQKILLNEKVTIFDLGAGINGLSINWMKKFSPQLKYIGVEAVGQKVDLMNQYFKKEKISYAKAIQASLFDLDFIIDLLKREKGAKQIFLFKILDSLEMVERDYSKKFLKEIVPLVDNVVVSFATHSLISKRKFNVKRYWFFNFIKQMGWKILDKLEFGNEKYIIFSK